MADPDVTVGAELMGEPMVVAAVFEDSPAIHVAMQGPEHRIVAINAVTRRLLGERRLLDLPCAEAIPELLGQQLVERLDEVYATGMPVTARDWRVQLDADADGAIDLEWYATFVMSPWRHADGSIRGVIVQAMDTSTEVLARRRTERLSGEFQRRYRAALDVVADLQQALLPTSLPVLPQVEMSARYLVADAEQAAGGDWFDGFALADGRLAVIVGDVVGHGVAAAAVMSQLRAVLGHVLDSGAGLADALTQLDRFARRTPGGAAATVCVVLVEPDTGNLTYATCGHPPPLLIDVNGRTRYLPATGHRPLGTGSMVPPASEVLAHGELIVLYSDGLVERPGRGWDTGTALLATVAADAVLNRGLAMGAPTSVPERVCVHAVELLTRPGYLDDVTVLALQRRARPVPPCYGDYDAVPGSLALVRHKLRRWLAALLVTDDDEQALIVAASEVATNCVEHAYHWGERGSIRVQANLTTRGDALLVISDHGRWRTPAPSSTDRGRGLAMVADVMEELTIESDPDRNTGTVVRMRRMLHRPVGATRPIRAPEFEPPLSAAFTPEPVPVLAVNGPVDMVGAEDLRRRILRASRAGVVPITVDLTGATYLGSAGVRVLHAITEVGDPDRRGDSGTDGGPLVHRPALTAIPGSPAAYVLELTQLPWTAKTPAGQ
jgi:anti-sigma regulatory factor (Ser/Thr protein kinase)